MLDEFGPGLWLADGPVVTGATGFVYPTRMAVMRLANGELVIWSPVALSEGLKRSVAALGRPRFLVAPNSLHHLFLREWQQAYPAAKVYGAPGLREKCPDIRFDGIFDHAALPEWSDEIDFVVISSNRLLSEVVFFHRQSGTAIFTDLLQQLPPGWFSGWRAVIARLDLMSGSEPAVPRKFRLAFTDRSAARSAFREILSWPAKGVIMAHGTPVSEGGQAFLRRAFGWAGL